MLSSATLPPAYPAPLQGYCGSDALYCGADVCESGPCRKNTEPGTPAGNPFSVEIPPAGGKQNSTTDSNDTPVKKPAAEKQAGPAKPATTTKPSNTTTKPTTKPATKPATTKPAKPTKAAATQPLPAFPAELGNATTQFSWLWGQEGELWRPSGRLPDYSYAGYMGETGCR